jgi:polar amino acid transport system permease protein
VKYQFDFSFLWDPENDYALDLLHGAWLTLQLSAVAIAGGFILGTLLAIARTGSIGWARRIVVVYVEIIRNTPLLVQTFWLFFGLAGAGYKITAFSAAVIAMSLNVAAYSSEIIRAGIESVRKGQIEAADSLGLSRASVLFDVILPPAIERVMPALISQYVLLMLATSIMAQISVEELMAAASRITSETFRGFEIFIVVAGIYIVMSVLVRLVLRGIGWLAFPRRRRLGTSL